MIRLLGEAFGAILALGFVVGVAAAAPPNDVTTINAPVPSEAFVSGGSATFSANDAAANVDDRLQLFQHFLDTVNQHDAAGAAALFSADATYQGGSCRILPSQTCVGRAAIQQLFDRTFTTQPDIHVSSLSPPQVGPDSITTRTEVRSSVIRKAGVDRYVNLRVWRIQNGTIANAIVTFDTTDAQTAKYVAVTQAPTAATLPRTGEPAAFVVVAPALGALALVLGLGLRTRTGSLVAASDVSIDSRRQTGQNGVDRRS